MKENEIMIEFNNYLEDSKGKNKLAILSSMHLVYNNTVTYPSVIGVTNTDGKNFLYTNFIKP